VYLLVTHSPQRFKESIEAPDVDAIQRICRCIPGFQRLDSSRRRVLSADHFETRPFENRGVTRCGLIKDSAQRSRTNRGGISLPLRIDSSNLVRIRRSPTGRARRRVAPRSQRRQPLSKSPKVEQRVTAHLEFGGDAMQAFVRDRGAQDTAQSVRKIVDAPARAPACRGLPSKDIRPVIPSAPGLTDPPHLTRPLEMPFGRFSGQNNDFGKATA